MSLLVTMAHSGVEIIRAVNGLTRHEVRHQTRISPFKNPGRRGPAFYTRISSIIGGTGHQGQGSVSEKLDGKERSSTRGEQGRGGLHGAATGAETSLVVNMDAVTAHSALPLTLLRRGVFLTELGVPAYATSSPLIPFWAAAAV